MCKGFERFLLFSLAISQSISLFSQSPSLTTLPDSWIPNGSIQRVTTGEGNAYISGGFDWVGPYLGRGVFLDKATGMLDQIFPFIRGIVLNKNDNQLPSGIYFYRIEFAGGRKTQSGYLTSKR